MLVQVCSVPSMVCPSQKPPVTDRHLFVLGRHCTSDMPSFNFKPLKHIETSPQFAPHMQTEHTNTTSRQCFTRHPNNFTRHPHNGAHLHHANTRTGTYATSHTVAAVCTRLPAIIINHHDMNPVTRRSKTSKPVATYNNTHRQQAAVVYRVQTASTPHR